MSYDWRADSYNSWREWVRIKRERYLQDRKWLGDRWETAEETERRMTDKSWPPLMIPLSYPGMQSSILASVQGAAGDQLRSP